MTGYAKGSSRALERWDDLFDILSAHPRRMILFSLLKAPTERRLRLPEAAVHSEESIDPEAVSLELRHLHLPRLEEVGYVRWQEEPFCVQRGPHFEEAAFLLEWIVESPEELPRRLVSDCNILSELVDDDGD